LVGFAARLAGFAEALGAVEGFVEALGAVEGFEGPEDCEISSKGIVGFLDRFDLRSAMIN
jgi:hypothetical protein